MSRRRVLIADDHALMAEGISSLLAAEYEIVGICADGRQLVADAITKQPDLIVLDIVMPQMNGLDAALYLRDRGCHFKLVFVTQQVDIHYLRAAFRAGASAYVAKQSAARELAVAMKKVLEGETYITPLLTNALPANVTAADLQNTPDALLKKLTPRQAQVLQLVAGGKSVKEISAVLNISPKTVEFHKNALMNETGLRTTAELTRYAVARPFKSIS